MAKQSKPYGTWDSPVTPHMLAGSIRLSEAQWDSDGKTLVWHERRADGGTLVCKPEGEAIRDLTDSSYKVSGRVGYGGGNFTVQGGNAYFVSSGRLHKIPVAGGTPQAITPKFGGAASPAVSSDGKYVAFVHTYEDEDVLALVDSDGKHWPQKIASGYDFVMQPAWHPDGKKLAYIAWNFPNMPWNGTELHVLTLEANEHGLPVVVDDTVIVGDENTAIFQPEFSPDGRYLSYVSDATGWGHIYLYDLDSGEHSQITDGEIDHIMPAWIQGMQVYGWAAGSTALYYTSNSQGFKEVHIYDLDQQTSLQIHEVDEYTYFDCLSVAQGDEEKIAMIAASSTTPPRVVTYSAEDGVQIARRSTTEALSTDDLSVAEAISWIGHDGEIAHGLYFAPKNSKYESDGLPPLMVLVHGGPTSQRFATFDDEVQFFTTRGYAVLQVNHRGSTGYGKAYMDKHKDSWGIYDVQDSITGAQHLVDSGLAHQDMLVIMGGSAGGYTTLQALVDEPGFFKAGVNSYGVANQFGLAMDTHKFESRYSDWLLGALPESAERYRDRSPIFHAHKIKDAVITFQGEDDVVVPKNQSDAIVSALRRNGVPHEYHVYAGEGHGFRKTETRIDFYEKVEKFLLQYVIFA